MHSFVPRALALVLALSFSAPSSPVRAENAAFVQIQNLINEATVAFDNYSYKKAIVQLERALTVAAESGLSRDPRLAEVHVLLGVAAIAGSNDLYRGLHSFVYALRLDAKATIPQKLATPQLAEMFAKAKQTIKSVGNPPTIQLVPTKEEAVVEVKRAQPGTSGLVHSPIDTAKRGYPIPVKVETGIDVQAHRVVLFFRPAGIVTFNALTMQKSGNTFRAAIPAEMTKGRYIHYYVEARDMRGRLAASFGSDRSPTVIIIK